MVDDELRKLVELHEQFGYISKMYITDESNIKVTYPSRIINGTPNKEMEVFYSIVEDGLLKTIKNSANRVKCPSYSTRLCILQDIVLTLIKRGQNSFLFRIVDEEGKDKEYGTQIVECLREPDKQNKKLEGELKGFFQKVMSGEDCSKEACASDVKEGYLVLIDTLRSGEI